MWICNSNGILFIFYLFLVVKYSLRMRNIPVRKTEEIPLVSLIKIWRPDVLPSLFSPMYSIGSTEPLYFSRSYLDAQ